MDLDFRNMIMGRRFNSMAKVVADELRDQMKLYDRLIKNIQRELSEQPMFNEENERLLIATMNTRSQIQSMMRVVHDDKTLIHAIGLLAVDQLGEIVNEQLNKTMKATRKSQERDEIKMLQARQWLDLLNITRRLVLS